MTKIRGNNQGVCGEQVNLISYKWEETSLQQLLLTIHHWSDQFFCSEHNYQAHPFNIKNLPILYERLADLFKDPSMAAFKRTGNSKDMVIRAILDNSFLNVGFKTCSPTWCLLCMHSANTDSFIRPAPVAPTKYCAKRHVFAQITASFLSVAEFALSNTLGKQVASTKESATTAPPLTYNNQRAHGGTCQF